MRSAEPRDYTHQPRRGARSLRRYPARYPLRFRLMAGKTIPGIGEDESGPVEPADAADSGAGDSRPFYSGPTVVDDIKVEEGLKKLRSLDAPPGPLTGITKAVVDALEPARSGSTPQVSVDLSQLTPSQVVAHQMRETAVGRNVVGPTVGQQEIQAFDDRALRG